MNLPDTRLIVDRYQLTQPIEIEAMDEELFFIDSPTGNFVLKTFPSHTTLDQQRYEHWLLLALNERQLSFAVPCPLRDQQGATFQIVNNGDIWVMVPRLEGERVIPNDPDHAYAVGAALADLHRTVALLQPLLRPDLPDYNINQRILLHLRDVLPTEPYVLGLQQSPEGKHRLRRFLTLAEHFQEPPAAPDSANHWHIINGDFFGSNLLYDGEKISAALDFKFAHPDYRAREFAETLLRVSTDLGPLFWGTARSFVEGYAAFLNLTQPEIELVPRFMLEYQVDRILFFAGQHPARAAKALRIQEDISAWLEVEQSRLDAMLRGVFLGE